MPAAAEQIGPSTIALCETIMARQSSLSWTGCQWKALPKEFPPKSIVHHYFVLWYWDGTLERIHHALYVAVREL